MSGLGELIELDAYRRGPDDDHDPTPPAGLGRIPADEGLLEAQARDDDRDELLLAA